MSNYPILSGPERDAILAGLRILQRDLERGCVGDDIMPILTDEGSHAGLSPDEIETLIEETVNTGVLLHDKWRRPPPEVATGALSPVIEAEAYPDDRPFTVDFPANRWFAKADAGDIIELAAEGWANSEASDRVAQDTAAWNADVARVFSHQGLISSFGNRSIGFECRINGEQAMAWLKQHRPDVWARIICEQHEIRLVEATEPEIRGRWDWIDEPGSASDASLETIGEAALDAVRALKLEYDPQTN